MDNILKKIKTECSTYLEESWGNPAIKNLHFDGRFVKKVKVRRKKQSDNFIQLFDEAFESEYREIYGRSIFCNGSHQKPSVEDKYLFYVFPINGYKFLYNPDADYHKEYHNIYEKLKSTIDAETAKLMFKDMIKYSYNAESIQLADALFSENEIIVYNIPYYYAVMCNKHPNYTALLNTILDS